MGKKKACPVGLICIDTHYLIILLSIFILILLYFLFFNQNSNQNSNLNKNTNNNSNSKKGNCSKKINNDVVKRYNNVKNTKNNTDIINNIEKEIKGSKNIIINYKPDNQTDYLVNKDHERIINPLIPPERRNHYINDNPYEHIRDGVPINIPTRGYTGGIVQVGALYKEDINNEGQKVGNNSETIILPLFGMPTHTGSNKWIYYTTSDKFNQVKLPITNKNKVCNSDYGCEELYENDIVSVPAYNGNFKVVKYEYDKPKYLPFIH